MRAYVHWLLVSILTVTSLTGCARRVSETRFKYRPLRQIHIAGHIRWTGQIPGRSIKVSATPVPQSIAGAGSSSLEQYILRPNAGTAENDLGDLSKVTGVEVSSRVRKWPLGPWKAGRPRRETGTVKYYVVKVVAPPGWRVTPPMRKISRSTRNADFVLTPP